jgi:long-subunit acyl-CoA synthetase (AMP-forming)
MNETYPKYLSLESFFAKADLTRIQFVHYVGQDLHEMSLGDFYHQAQEYQAQFQKEDSFVYGFILPHTIETLEKIIGAMLAKKRVALIPETCSVDIIQKIIVSSNIENLVYDEKAFDEEEVAFFKKSLQSPSISSDNEAELLFFTSGTTGPSKGVLLSFSSFLASAYNGQSRLATTPKDTVISFLPFEHVFGFVCSFLWPLLYGSKIAISRGLGYLPLDLKALQPTIIPLVPAIAKFILKTSCLNEEAKTILVGSGPMEDQELFVYKKLGLKVAFGYGLTETASGVAISVDSDVPSLMSPCPEDEFKIEHDGALAIKSSCLMKGYYVNGQLIPPHLDKEGYFITNDLAKIDKEGRLKIEGRIDDVLVLENGTKINANQAESILSSELLNIDFALGVKDGKLTLFYHPKNIEESLSILNEIDKYNGGVERSKQIENSVKLNEPLPRTLTNKVRRFLLASSK